jgi:hypothetical protein
MEWNGMEWNWIEWNGMELNWMEWNGMEFLHECVRVCGRGTLISNFVACTQYIDIDDKF